VKKSIKKLIKSKNIELKSDIESDIKADIKALEQQYKADIKTLEERYSKQIENINAENEKSLKEQAKVIKSNYNIEVDKKDLEIQTLQKIQNEIENLKDKEVKPRTKNNNKMKK